MSALNLSFSKYFLYFLVAAGNSVAFLGVLKWNWDLYNIFYLYWLENLIIGVVTLIRMLLQGAHKGVVSLLGALFTIVFFMFHYGIFTVGHGVIMTEIFLDHPVAETINSVSSNGFIGAFIDPLKTLLSLPFVLGVEGFIWVFFGIVLVECVHGLRQIMDDRFKGRAPQNIMFSPYGRIVVLHLTILLGAAAVGVVGESIAALVVFILFKTIYDLSIMKFVDKKKEKEIQNVLE